MIFSSFPAFFVYCLIVLHWGQKQQHSAALQPWLFAIAYACHQMKVSHILKHDILGINVSPENITVTWTVVFWKKVLIKFQQVFFVIGNVEHYDSNYHIIIVL